MTVTNTTNTIRESGNGVKVAFDFTFKIFADTDLEVSKIDTSVTPEVVTLQVLNTDYTVVFDTSAETGTVTYTVAPLGTEDSFIKRVLPLTQQTNIPTASNIPEVALENEYDKSRMIDQQLNEANSRSITFAETSTTTGVTFPELVANKAILVNPAGDDLITSTDDFDTIVTDAAASASAATTSASNAATSETNAATSETNAATSATDAANSAAGVNLPPIVGGDAGKYLEVNSGETGYDLVNPVNSQTDTVITASDEILFADVTDSDNLKKDTVQGILDLVPASNLIINGDFTVAQRGTTFDSTTNPANNDDTYLLDRWVLLSDGNDVVDVSQETTVVPTGVYASMKLDVETANLKFGLLEIIEGKDSAAIIGGTASLSFQAQKVVGNATLETLRAAVISWDSTEDVVTSDVVSAWNGAGTDPTLVANWTYENTPSNLTLTDSFQTFTIENISIDTSSTKNVAVFIWVDDVDATVGDLAYITNIKLESGTTATSYVALPFAEELALAQRYFERLNGGDSDPIGSGYADSTTFARGILTYSPKMKAPTIASSGSTHLKVRFQGDSTTASTANSFANNTKEGVGKVALAGLVGLTAGNGVLVEYNGASRFIEIDAEL